MTILPHTKWPLIHGFILRCNLLSVSIRIVSLCARIPDERKGSIAIRTSNFVETFVARRLKHVSKPTVLNRCIMHRFSLFFERLGRIDHKQNERVENIFEKMLTTRVLLCVSVPTLSRRLSGGGWQIVKKNNNNKIDGKRCTFKNTFGLSAPCRRRKWRNKALYVLGREFL